MSQTMNESDLFRAVLIGEAESRAGAHPELEVLAEYHAGALDAETEERVRDHLAACRRCAARALDLAPLANPEPARAEGVADLEVEAAWRELQSRLRLVPAARTAGLPRWSLAIAAALLIASVGLSVATLQLREANSALRLELAELTKPEVNTPVIYLHGVTRGPATGDAIDVPPSARRFLLILTPEGLGTAEEYGVEVLDEEGGMVLSRDGLEMSADGGLRLSLPRGYLPAGAYRIRLRALEGETWTLLEEYRRTIRYAPAPDDGASGEAEAGAG